jgi:uncharacterized protein (TIGR02246 family)
MLDKDDVAREIEAVANRSKDAIARKDIEAALQLLTNDVVLLTASGPPIVGLDAVRELYRGLLSRYHIENTASRSDFTVEAVGDVAIVTGNDQAVMTPLDGGPVITVEGRAISIFRREARAWKLARAINLMTPVRT